VSDILYLFYARGRIRTDPGRILSPLSLPLDYTGVYATIVPQKVIIVKCSSRESNPPSALYENAAFDRLLDEQIIIFPMTIGTQRH
jgi:hypothetical protein